MIDYREILRLNSLGFSNVDAANSIRSSRNKVSEVLKLAEEHEQSGTVSTPDGISTHRTIRP